MTIHCMGRINVLTPGTIVPLTTDPTITACKLLVQAIPGATGKTYLGNSSLNASTLAGAARVFVTDSTTFLLEAQTDSDGIRIADYAIDADVAGEGLLVTYWCE